MCGGTFVVRPSDHLELQIGHDLRQGNDGPIGEVAGAEPARLLAAEEGEDDRALRARAARERLRELEHRHTSRRVIVRAVVDGVGTGRGVRRRAHAQVIEMCGKKNDLGRRGWIAPGQAADRVPRLGLGALLDLGFDADRRAFGKRRDGVVGFLAQKDRRRSRRRGALDADKACGQCG